MAPFEITKLMGFSVFWFGVFLRQLGLEGKREA